MKSFNIVAETAQFVNLVYSSINPQTVELVVQLFETLNEFTVVGTRQYNCIRWHHCWSMYIQTRCCHLEVCGRNNHIHWYLHVVSGGSTISRSGESSFDCFQSCSGAPTPDTATFHKICMSKRKNRGALRKGCSPGAPPRIRQRFCSSAYIDHWPMLPSVIYR